MIETGITFDDVHSYYDLNLVLSQSEISPAKPKTNFVDIPGGNGSVDLTEAQGDIFFYDRNCKFTFTMNASDDLTDEAFEEKKTEVSNLLNGKRLRITLDKDSGYFYEGRCEVNEYLSNKKIRQIVITAKVDPYKYKQKRNELLFVPDGTEMTIVLKNSRMPVAPTILGFASDVVVRYEGERYLIEQGVPDNTHGIILKEGSNKLSLEATGLVTIEYQEGDL